MAAAALAAALVGRVLSALLPGASVLAESLLVLAAFGVVYLALGAALGLEEARALLGRFGRGGRGP